MAEFDKTAVLKALKEAADFTYEVTTTASKQGEMVKIRATTTEKTLAGSRTVLAGNYAVLQKDFDLKQAVSHFKKVERDREMKEMLRVHTSGEAA